MNQESDQKIQFIFGGTFDPVHLGHLAIIDAIKPLSKTATIRILLCALPALKSQPQTSFKSRLTMLQLALKADHRVIIDTREKERQEPSYTFDSLISLRKDFPDSAFILVMGMDSLQDIQQWYHWQDLATVCHLLVINRPGSDINAAHGLMQASGFKPVAEFSQLIASSKGNGMVLKMTEKEQSSTAIREAIKRKLALGSLLTQPVIDYISNHHLYESENN